MFEFTTLLWCCVICSIVSPIVCYLILRNNPVISAAFKITFIK